MALACGAAYANTFAVPLVADDLGSIGGNPTIRRLWPLSIPLHPPGFGMTVQGRPLLNLSLAVNYAISGTQVWSYHAGNLLIHILAAWTLFGVLRRGGSLLWRGIPREPANERSLTGGALLVALIWAVHPLQTEAVTYLVQRAESLMGLCYLWTLYAFLRGVEGSDGSPARRRNGRVWLTASAAACLLGMTAKEVMVSAPVIVLACDRCLVTGSLREAWRRRWGYYLVLAATWIPLIVLAVHAGSRGGASGPGPGLTFVQYWLTQPSAIAAYLRRVFWPAGQVFYYGAPWVDSVRSILPALLLVGALAGATLYGLARTDPPGRALLGFLGLWFFAILAPTSLVPGRSQTMAEHRMYLASIPVLIAAAVAVGWCGWRVSRWLPRRACTRVIAGVGCGTVALLALTTYRRNEDYATARILYAHDVAVMPQSGAARFNLGTACLREGSFAEAVV
jgi:hypothetical protein